MKRHSSVNPLILIAIPIICFLTVDWKMRGKDSIVTSIKERKPLVIPTTVEELVKPTIKDELQVEDEELHKKLDTDMNYAYIHLNEEDQELYRKIYKMLIEHKENAEVLIEDKDNAEMVYESVLNDNPEIYYTEGYIWMDRPNSSDSIMGSYTMTAEEIEEHQQRIDKEVEKIIANVPKVDDYEKVKYLYEYLVQTTEYDLDASYTNGIISVFENHRTICNGYTKAFQYLCKQLDIPCAFISGEADGAWGWDKHAWNMVKIDNNWYFVDVTWGDGSFRSDPTQFINHTYLCATSEDIKATHKIDMPYIVEDCTAIKDNYYQREGLYFNEIDGDKLQRIFTTTEGNLIELKCATEELTRRLKYYLVDDYKIYNYLPQDTKYSYALNEESCILLILK